MQNANITNNPHLIFNCNETGLLLEFKPSKVVGRKEIRLVYSVTLGTKGQVTLLVCANVAGVILPQPSSSRGRRRTKQFQLAPLPNGISFLRKKGG